MFIEVDHPCIKAKMTVLRNKNTNPKEFRERAEEITCFLAYEALKNLHLTETTVETPLETTVGYTVENDIVVVPVLRAGVGMLGGIQSLIPTVKVGFVGLQRDHDTKHPVKYYLNLPKPSAEAFPPQFPRSRRADSVILSSSPSSAHQKEFRSWRRIIPMSKSTLPPSTVNSTQANIFFPASATRGTASSGLCKKKTRKRGSFENSRWMKNLSVGK